MTHLVDPAAFKTKKAFKEAAKTNPSKVFVFDPSPIAPMSGKLDAVMHHRSAITVTNHHWTAAVERKADGTLKVS